MRPLPRLHAVTDADVLADPSFGVRMAALASAGPAVALHARGRSLTGAALTALARRMFAHAAPPEAAVFVNGRPDVARAIRAHGVQLGATDMATADARAVFAEGWIGRSVHSTAEAGQAADEGADFLMVGSIFQTATHPGYPAAGIALVEQAARFGLPIIAIGGITAERVRQVKNAGAYGVAAISALWRQPDSARAAAELLEPWEDV